MKSRVVLLAAALVLMTGSTLQAKVKLPGIIGDNMVLQQQTHAAIWGTADPGKTVSVLTSWNKQTVKAVADKETGKWMVRVATPAAGGPYEMTISDGQKVTLKNILIGEVWYASGQSNMEMPVKGYGSQPAKGGTDKIISARASRPLRICNVKRTSAIAPKEEAECKWEVHTPDAVANTSATAYFFADAIQNVIDVPVGIIITCWGGSSIETWIDRKTIESGFPEFDISYLDGKKAVKENDNHSPCLLYNGQVHPLVPYTFKGMIWYQGETNRGREEQYIRLQTAYVKMMREIFHVPDAPFYFVQIAPYPYGKPEDFTSGYFCEAQQKSLQTIPHSGMATTADVGEYGTIHPCRKQEVGQRLALLALKHDYGQDVLEADAPVYKSVEFKDGKAYVSFDAGKLGLSPMGTNIIGFEVAGADKVFHKAEAYVENGSTIRTWSAQVPEPVAVRYCFRNWAVGGLFNNFGVPAGPFRTDDWPR